MLLAIDVGNTNTVFAIYKGEELFESWRCSSEATRSADEYASFLNELFTLSNIKWDDFEDVIVSSVVPEANFHIRGFCEKYLSKETLMVTHDLVGLQVSVDRPEEVGADRLVNSVAVLEHYQAPAIVIDFGTATTFDVIDAKGRYSGGVISPGINLSVSALHQAAAKLPSVSIKKIDSVIGTDTVSAIQSGVYWGYVGLIEGVVARIKEEIGEDAKVIATGGLANLFADETPVIDTVDQDLTLKGLLKIYQNHKAGNVTEFSQANA